MGALGTRRWFGRSLAVAVAVLLQGAPAHAATKIGDSYPQTATCATSNPGLVEIQRSSASNAYEAPYDGVITSWRNEGGWPTLTFKVARLGAGSSYTVIGSDGPRSMAGSAPESFAVRIPVRQGDVIGARRGSVDFECTPPGTAADSIGRDETTDVPVGGTGFFDSTVSNATVPIEAYIERDRDNDGYGDETQDACPTSAATQGACPLPTTLGRTFTPSSTSVTTGTAIPALPADYRYSAPADGVITSWSYEANGLVDGTAKLKVVRALGGDSFQVVVESEPRTPTANTLNTFPTRLSVRAGDRIGIGANNLPVISPSVFDFDSSWFAPSDPAPGASATFTKSSRFTNVAAILEADADADGFGDTTQDLCPSDPSTQGQCPIVLPPPPPDDDGKCEQARKKLEKAKAKLKKLKQNDAAAKKLKKAKAKVEKAKKAVKKAC